VEPGVVIEEYSPPQIVSRSRDFLQHNRELIKKTGQSWRVSARLFAYAHEPAKTNTPEKPKQKANLKHKNQCKLKTQK
jgi:hypothetical protein